MYLSKLMLNIDHPSVRQALRNCQDMHKNLMQAFCGTREEAGMLYRLEKKANAYEIYVLSKQQPDWEKTYENGYRCIGVKDISALKELCHEGSDFRFVLRACPAKKVQGESKNSRRVFLTSEQERTEWLNRQAKKYGFKLLELHETVMRDSVAGSKGADRICYRSVDFSGVICIEESASFWESFCCGIGSGKAYGLGMMLLTRS